MKYILERLRERSTWAGIGAFVSGIGVAIKPEYWEAISGAGVAFAGLIYTLSADR